MSLHSADDALSDVKDGNLTCKESQVINSRLQVFIRSFLLFTQSLINEEGKMTPCDLAHPADWTPLAYISACEALKDFGLEVNKALKSNSSLTDLETTFEVRHGWCPLTMQGSMLA